MEVEIKANSFQELLEKLKEQHYQALDDYTNRHEQEHINSGRGQ